MRLTNNHHFSWSATTGRPPIIPDAYLRQYRILLKFEQATILDSMAYAETALYTILHEELVSNSYANFDGKCEGLMDWKAKWMHLFGMMTCPSILEVLAA